MGRTLFKRHYAAFLVLAGSALLAGCQQGPSGEAAQAATGQPVRESELRAFCPPITIREGTAFYRTFERGGEGDLNRLIHQVSIDETTRACTYGEGTGSVTIAFAGRVVPGPRGRTGTVSMPIRVVALRGSEVLYSELRTHPVNVADTAGATQFLVREPNIAIPGGIDRNVRILVGFDEGQR